MSNLFNPKPTYNWESLDLKEVERLTKIRLQKPWKYYFTNFHEGQVDKHKDDCAYLNFWNPGKCNCNPEQKTIVQAVLKAGLPESHSSGRGQYYYVNVSTEPNIDREKLINPELRPPEILQDLQNGLDTLITFLKVFEVTGKTFDYGPPMRLYKTGSGNAIYDLEEIDGDRLWNILHCEILELKA